MSDYVCSPYSFNSSTPNSFVLSPFPKDEMESDVRQHKSHPMNRSSTGTASVPQSAASWITQSPTVATSSASSGNSIFPFRSINQMQGQSSQSDAYLHDFGYPIDSSAIDLALSQSQNFAFDIQNASDDTDSLLPLQEARALEAHHLQKAAELRDYINIFESRILNNSPALSRTRTLTTAGAGYGDAHHGSGLLAENFAQNPANLTSLPYGIYPQASRPVTIGPSDTYPFPPIDSSKFMTRWKPSFGAANDNFANGSRPFEGQMGMVDVQMSGMSAANPSGPRQMNSLGSLAAGSSIGQSSNSRGTAALGSLASSTNLNSSSSPIRSPAQHWSQKPKTASGSTSTTGIPISASDRPPPCIPCPIFDCHHTATTKRDMQRHVDDRHDDRKVELLLAGWELSAEILCRYEQCKYKARRMDRMNRHVATVHRKGR